MPSCLSLPVKIHVYCLSKGLSNICLLLLLYFKYMFLSQLGRNISCNASRLLLSAMVSTSVLMTSSMSRGRGLSSFVYSHFLPPSPGASAFLLTCNVYSPPFSSLSLISSYLIFFPGQKNNHSTSSKIFFLSKCPSKNNSATNAILHQHPFS